MIDQFEIIEVDDIQASSVQFTGPVRSQNSICSYLRQEGNSEPFQGGHINWDVTNKPKDCQFCAQYLQQNVKTMGGIMGRHKWYKTTKYAKKKKKKIRFKSGEAGSSIQWTLNLAFGIFIYTAKIIIPPSHRNIMKVNSLMFIKLGKLQWWALLLQKSMGNLIFRHALSSNYAEKYWSAFHWANTFHFTKLDL